MKHDSHHRRHRAWLVFGGVCLYYFVAFGLIYSGFGLFLSPMSEDLGIPYVQLSVTATIRVLCGMVTTALIGRIFPKVRLRYFLTLILLILAGTIMLVSVSNKMWQFIPIFALMGLCCGLTLYGIVPVILNQWFEAPSSLITIATAFGGAGGIVLCPLLSQIISLWGWRSGYRFMVVLVLLVMLPIALLLLDFSPSDRGLVPLPGKNPPVPNSPAPTDAHTGFSGSPLLLGLLTAFFLVSALSGGLYIHISSALHSKGFSAVQVSLLVSAFQAGTALLQFFPGLISAKTGLRPICNVVFPLVALNSVILIFLAPESPFLLAVPVVFLLGGSRIFTSLNPLIARHVFGQKEFHRHYPGLQAVYLVGTALTSVIYGSVYSLTESYSGTLWMIVCCMILLLLLSQLIFKSAARSSKSKSTL